MDSSNVHFWEDCQKSVIDIEGGRKIDQPGESLKEGWRRKKTCGIRAEVLGQGMALIEGVHRAVYY